MLNDIRKDYLLDRWVVIATHRRRRPTDFTSKKPTAKNANTRSCPFCPGNERMTPPAVLVYLMQSGKLRKDKDTNGVRHKTWQIRCVPNLYSAFSPPEEDETFESGKAVGHHEVLVESPKHREHPSDARISQLIHVINGYKDRTRTLLKQRYVKYVSIFRNHGLEAGASLSHAHSQIMATPTIPTIPKDELKASKDFYQKHKRCVFCDILEKEKEGPRFIWENEEFAAFAPRAGIHPFEFWLLPQKHHASILGMRPKSVKNFAKALKTCFTGLKLLLDDPPYNFGLHVAPDKSFANSYHWHLEAYPKLTIWAGFEKSTGMYINVVPPEDGAQDLRQSIDGMAKQHTEKSSLHH